MSYYSVMSVIRRRTTPNLIWITEETLFLTELHSLRWSLHNCLGMFLWGTTLNIHLGSSRLLYSVFLPQSLETETPHNFFPWTNYTPWKIQSLFMVSDDVYFLLVCLPWKFASNMKMRLERGGKNEDGVAAETILTYTSDSLGLFLYKKSSTVFIFHMVCCFSFCRCSLQW